MHKLDITSGRAKEYRESAEGSANLGQSCPRAGSPFPLLRFAPFWTGGDGGPGVGVQMRSFYKVKDFSAAHMYI